MSKILTAFTISSSVLIPVDINIGFPVSCNLNRYSLWVNNADGILWKLTSNFSRNPILGISQDDADHGIPLDLQYLSILL